MVKTLTVKCPSLKFLEVIYPASPPILVVSVPVLIIEHSTVDTSKHAEEGRSKNYVLMK